MRSFALACVVFLAACGGGGGGDASALSNGPGEDAPQPTAAELFAGCFQQDAAQLAQVLALLGGFLDNDGGAVPPPTVDFVSGLLSGGSFPYSWDLDGDTVDELSGRFRFVDANGATTIPFSLAELVGFDLNDPASILAAVPAGSRLELTFEAGGTLLAATNAGAGEGTLLFRFGEGAVSAIAGDGSFSSGECTFEAGFDEFAIDPAGLTGYPTATVEFTAGVGADSLRGTIALDGTSTATVEAAINGGVPESFAFELPDPALLPSLP